jgi:hypothetical protein
MSVSRSTVAGRVYNGDVDRGSGRPRINLVDLNRPSAIAAIRRLRRCGIDPAAASDTGYRYTTALYATALQRSHHDPAQPGAATKLTAFAVWGWLSNFD